MVINLGSHVLKITTEGIDRWDVYRIKQILEGEHKGETREASHAYGLRIKRAIQVVIQDRIDTSYEGEEFDGEEFINKYHEISEGVLTKFKEECDKINKVKA